MGSRIDWSGGLFRRVRSVLSGSGALSFSGEVMNPYYQDSHVTLYHADAVDGLASLSDGSVQCCVTSPPYWGLRDYGHADQIGLEETPVSWPCVEETA